MHIIYVCNISIYIYVYIYTHITIARGYKLMGVEILWLYPCVNYQKHPPNKDFNGFQAPRSTGHHFMAPNLPTTWQHAGGAQLGS